jgi:DivIVA domain-containing protein
MPRFPGDPLSEPDLHRLPEGSFTHVRWREGYDIGQVDAFIERAAEELASPTPAMRPADVRAARFRPVRVREGYEMAEVDAYLDELEQRLARRSPDPEPEPSAPAAHPLLAALKSGAWTGKLTWVLLLLVVLLLVFAMALRPHWAGH